MDLVGDAVIEIVLFLPNSSLNRLRQINFVFLQAIRGRIAQLSASALKTIPICELREMTEEQNKMDALKAEIENIKKDMKAVAQRVDLAEKIPMLDALALMLTLLEKVTGLGMGLDTSFTIPFSWMDEIAAAWKNVYGEIYASEPEVSLRDEKDLRDAIESCTDEGMLHPRFDGRYQLAPHTHWKTYKQRQTKKRGGGV